MSDITHGMEIAEIRRFGEALRGGQAERVVRIANEIDASIQSMSAFWTGPDADRFRSWWPAKRARLFLLADDLTGFAQSALNNADEQERVSGGGSASGSGAHQPSGANPVVVASSDIYEISTDQGFFALVGSDASGQVEVMRLSDGTYRVVLNSEEALGADFSVAKLLGTEDLQGGADIGLGVEASGGWSIEFAAADKESAEQLADVLSGRVSSITNRAGGDSIDVGEILHQEILKDPRITFESITERHLGFGTDASAVGLQQGFDASLSSWNETSTHRDGSTVHRTIVDGSLERGGWDQGGESERLVYEVTTDPDGRPTSVVYERTTMLVDDTRGGGEKFRDFALDSIPGVEVGNTDARLSVEVHRIEIDSSGFPPDLQRAADDLDRVKVSELARQYASNGTESHVHYSGSDDSSERGLDAGIYSYRSSTGYGELRFDLGRVRGPGEPWRAIVDAGESPMHAQVIETPQGNQVVFTGEF